jgi:AcrR family transcriptional regulator
MKERETMDKKTRIIKAATEMFSMRGVRSTTVDQIAKRAGIGKGTIYYYYTDKTEILLDCYMRHIASTRSEVIDQCKNEKDILFGLWKILHYISKEYHQDPFVSTLFQEYKEHRLPEIEMCIKQSEEWAIRMVTQLLEEGQKKGQLHDMPLPLTAFMLVRMFFVYESDFEKSPTSDHEFLHLLERMLLTR